MAKFADILSPLLSSKFIADNSKHVKIDERGIGVVAEVAYEGAKKNKLGISLYKEATLHPKTADAAALDWIFLVDTLNFCFWAFDGDLKYTVSLDGQAYIGYWSLCAAVNRALREGIPLTDASYYAALDADTLSHILRSDSSVKIPMLERRLQVLRETGQILLEKFEGKFVNCLKQCDGSSVKLMALVYDNFPSYRDVAFYKGTQVSFLKRLQILVADIWLAFEGQGHGKLTDIDDLTVLADYRIPQVLAFYGALTYSDDLTELLKKDSLLENGCEEEVEIRGCTIRAVELITLELQKKLASEKVEWKTPYCNMITVDNFLWGHRRELRDDMDAVPFHKVVSIYY